MKPVQVLFDEELLSALDADPEVQSIGRSRVLRRVVASYLQQRRRETLDAEYAAGYGSKATVSEDLEGWDEEGEWPER